MVPEFFSLLLISVCALIDSEVFEHSCGNGYFCKEEESLSYLVYEIYYDNYEFEVEHARAKIRFTLDDNDYDFKTVDIFATYQELEKPHSHSPTEKHGKSMYFKANTSSFSDDTTLEITAISIPRAKTLKISVLIEVLEDSNGIFEDISAVITFKTELIINGQDIQKTSDWKQIGEIDDNVPRINDTDSSALEEDSADTSTENIIGPQEPESRFFTIAVMTAITMSLALLSSAIFYIYIKKHQADYILMNERNHFD